MKSLTEKQEVIFHFIQEKIREFGFPPTVREIGERFNITVKGAYDHLKAIEKKGYIRCAQNKSRAIEILVKDEVGINAVNIPLLGSIAAGSPVLAEENIEDYLSFPESVFGKGVFFALRVKGDSMIDAGIHDGDIAIIRKQKTVNNGEVIAALIDDEATLKIFKKEKNKVKLLPANPAYEPLILNEVDVLGKLTAVFRRY
jgi:repressor LexA